ncbi:AAEL000552-PA, partial [Aedes aegypti]
LIENVYQKWNNNPVIVTFDERPLPVWALPFPAVTICPQATIRSNINLFSRIDRLMAVLQICDEFFHVKSKYLNMYHQVSHENIVPVLQKLSPLVNQTILTCRVNGVRCNELFTETITDEGICFTFNGFSSYDMFKDGVLHDEYQYLNEPKNVTNWSMDEGYTVENSRKAYPIRALGSGFAAGLTMRLMALDSNIEEHCREQQGFKVTIHAPNEYPQVSKKFSLVTHSHDVALAVRPIIMQTSFELRDYDPQRRNCYFHYERQLKFFEVYTQANCEVECVTNYTLEACGCVKFSMPRSPGTRLCQTSEIICVINAEYNMLKRTLEESGGSACDCIPSCISIQYDAEITQSKKASRGIIWVDFCNRYLILYFSSRQISKLAIYFKEVQFITSKRSELFGLTDFVANCGGILGLCLGVSLFSLIELLYFCLARP